MRKQVFKIDNFVPGLMKGIVDKVNIGYTRFENLILDYLGRPRKRDGWRNTTLTFDGLDLYTGKVMGDLTGFYDIENGYNKPYLVDVHEDDLQKELPDNPDVIKFIVPVKAVDTTVLYKAIQDSTGTTIGQTQITVPASSLPAYPLPSDVREIKYIHTPYQTFMIQDGYPLKKITKGLHNKLYIGGEALEKTTDYGFVNNRNQQYLRDRYYAKNVYEYGYCDFQAYTPRKVITSSRTIADYYYTLVPLYATGREGSAEVYEEINQKVIGLGRIVAVVERAGDTSKREIYQLGIPSQTPHLWDENIIGYRMYRTGKGDTKIKEELPINWDNRARWATYVLTAGMEKKYVTTTKTVKGDLAVTAANKKIGNISLRPDGLITVDPKDMEKFRFVRDFMKDTDLKYDPVRLAFMLWDTETDEVWYDDVYDNQLGLGYQVKGSLNTAYLNDFVYNDTALGTPAYSQFGREKNGTVIDCYTTSGLNRVYGYETTDKSLDSLPHPNAGIYYNNLMVINDIKRPTLVLVSELEGVDGFYADRMYNIIGAHSGNPVTNFISVGSALLVFTHTSIDMFRPTNNPEQPFVLQRISSTIGCDSNISACTVDNVGYFIYKKELFSIDSNGQISPIGANIAIDLKTTTTTIRLISSPRDGEVYIIFQSEYFEAPITQSTQFKDRQYKTIIYNTRKKIWYTENILRDKFYSEVVGSYPFLSVDSKVDDGNTINYWYLPGKKEEYSINKWIELRNRTETPIYKDENKANGITVWAGVGVSYTGTDPVTNEYIVRAVMERPLAFDTNVIITSIILYGSGTYSVSINPNNRGYIKDRLIILNESLGTEIPLNLEGNTFKLRITHEQDSDINLDLIQVKTTAKSKAGLINEISSGDTGGNN